MKIRLFTLPNILTLMNLLCGSLAVVSIICMEPAEALRTSFYLMLAAAVFDFLDGFAARLTKSYSKLGVQLDSLADMVSFGLLPSIIMFRIYYISGGEGLWGVITLAVVLFSALRLAKFNIDETQREEFEGLPTPANALLIGAAGYFLGTNGIDFPACAPWIVLASALLLSWLLISPVKMFSLKFKGFGFRGNAVRYIFLAAAAALVIIFGLSGIAPAIILYILSSLIMWLARRGKVVK